MAQRGEKYPNSAGWYRFDDLLFHAFMLWPGHAYRELGLENIPETKKPFWATFTHKNVYDGPLAAHGIFHKTGQRIDFMAKPELMAGLQGKIVRAHGSFSVNQYKADMSAVREALDRVKAGRVVGLAIEGGGKKKDGSHLSKETVERISPSIGLFMCLSTVDTLPVAVVGNVTYYRDGRLAIVKKSLTQYGKPIAPPDEEFDTEAILSTGRTPLKLRQTLRDFARDKLQPSFDDLYADTVGQYEEIYGEAVRT